MRYLPRILLTTSFLAFAIFVGFFSVDVLNMLTDDGIMPRSLCWAVKAELLPWNYGAHTAIMLAYFGIGSRLLLISYRRGKQFLTYETVLFGSFIFLCGVTHLTALLMFFWGIATLDTIVLDITAVISVLAMLRTFTVARRIEQAPSLEEVENVKREYLEKVEQIKEGGVIQMERVYEMDLSAQRILDLVARYAQAGTDKE